MRKEEVRKKAFAHRLTWRSSMVDCTHEVSAEYHKANLRKRQRGNLMQKWIKCSGCNLVFLNIEPIMETPVGQGPEKGTL